VWLGTPQVGSRQPRAGRGGSGILRGKMRRNAAALASHSLAMVRAFALVSVPKPAALASTRVSPSWEEFSMMKRFLVASAALVLSTALGQAQEVKIGLVAPFTGIGAELGQQI